MTMWSDLLTSGDYKQGNGLLKTAEGNYCCLGVLEEACGIEFIPEYHYIDNERSGLYGRPYTIDQEDYDELPEDEKEGYDQIVALYRDEFTEDEMPTMDLLNTWNLSKLAAPEEKKYIEDQFGIETGEHEVQRAQVLANMNDNGSSFADIAKVITTLGWDVEISNVKEVL